jgi:hypothetical protein
MSKKLSVISHIFNEEFLLPYWLDYHSKIFDYGIIIDYLSTDRSVEIVKKMCPTWKVVTTKNITSDGKPNFDAKKIDDEVIFYERELEGFKIALNTTEFILYNGDVKNMRDFLELSSEQHIYHIDAQYSSFCKLYDSEIYPTSTSEFLNIFFNEIYSGYRPPHRFIHNLPNLNYNDGRHTLRGQHSKLLENFVIFHTGNFIVNKKMLKRRLQIYQNIPQHDRQSGAGVQHFLNNVNELTVSMDNINSKCKLCNGVKCPKSAYDLLNMSHPKIYYPELYVDSSWGDDRIILETDINLLENSDFDDNGFKCFKSDCNTLISNFITDKIFDLTSKRINIENYHNEITDEEHKQILHNMPYKYIRDGEDITGLSKYAAYLEKFVSSKINKNVRIFNDDIWIRICRPTKSYLSDFNPCHRDIYLDFYRNVVNIYVPVCGSDDKSSLLICSGSHKLNEKEIAITKGGTYFKHKNIKYSVDAIVASNCDIIMERPNPSYDEIMIFSPYLIHGCASNDNDNTTRISLEVRFILDDDNIRINQENDFNEFLKRRNWR